jgi:hypothetical protein
VAGELEIVRRGPKEWRPSRFSGTHLSGEDKEKAERLLHLATSGPLHRYDALWLKRLIERLAVAAPDEYSFPRYLAFVDQKIPRAWATRYQETLHLERAIDTEGHSVVIFTSTTYNAVCDATLVVRPYVRILRGFPEDIARLRESVLRMTIDNELVLSSPIDEHLIGLGGLVYRRCRWTLRSLTHSLFLACAMDEQQRADGNAMEGVFCPYGSMIQLQVSPPFFGKLRIMAGVVAARYTTKSEKGEKGEKDALDKEMDRNKEEADRDR